MFYKFEGTNEFFPDVESRLQERERERKKKERAASRRLHSVIPHGLSGTEMKRTWPSSAARSFTVRDKCQNASERPLTASQVIPPRNKSNIETRVSRWC